MSLYLYVPNENLRSAMKAHVALRRWSDSGFDLLSLRTVLNFSESHLAAEIKTGVHCAAFDERGHAVPYLLIVRSSTSLTPLRMSNQIGLADAGYRGELIARVDMIGDEDVYIIEHGRRLFQICQHNFLPWKEILFVNTLNDLPSAPDDRGSGGFGSTGH